MIFFFSSAMSIADTLEVRKLNAQLRALFFGAFIYEPVVTRMVWLTTAGSWVARLAKNVAAIPQGPEGTFDLQLFVELRNARRMI
jgi:hypothetical protein